MTLKWTLFALSYLACHVLLYINTVRHELTMNASSVYIVHNFFFFLSKFTVCNFEIDKIEMSKDIINPSSKPCYCLNLNHYSKPLVNIYSLELLGQILQGNCILLSFVCECLCCIGNKKTMVRLLLSAVEGLVVL